MPDMTQTRKAHETPGEDAPDLLILAELFAALTPQERLQAWSFLDFLLREGTA